MDAVQMRDDRGAAGWSVKSEGEDGLVMRPRIAATVLARLRGLAGRRAPTGEILLANCRDIHTFTMRREIDVAFVNAQGRVLEVYRALRPRTRRRCKEAVFVIERIAQDGWWLQAGDELGIIRLAPSVGRKEIR